MSGLDRRVPGLTRDLLSAGEAPDQVRGEGRAVGTGFFLVAILAGVFAGTQSTASSVSELMSDCETWVASHGDQGGETSEIEFQVQGYSTAIMKKRVLRNQTGRECQLYLMVDASELEVPETSHGDVLAEWQMMLMRLYPSIMDQSHLDGTTSDAFGNFYLCTSEGLRRKASYSVLPVALTAKGAKSADVGDWTIGLIREEPGTVLFEGNC